MTIERKMCSPTFDFQILDRNIQKVNAVKLTGGTDAGNKVIWTEKDYETVKFVDYQHELIQVPSVDDNGDCNGFTRWFNFKLFFDIRTMRTGVSYSRQGNLEPAGANGTSISWNQMLLHPGYVRQGIAVLNGTPNNLGWYYVGYNKGVEEVGDPDENVYWPTATLKEVFEGQ
jgi:hypothetical protein